MIALRCIFIALIGVLMVGCGPAKADRERLGRAEAIVREHPDSALAILDSISPEARENRELRARTAIVEAEACYQKSVRMLSDSLLDEAVEYYSSKPDSPRRLRALYLRVYQNYLAERYGNALVDYLAAEQSAKALTDSISLGLIYRGMGDLYSNIKDYSSALNSHKKSAQIFGMLKPQEYYPYSELELARAYFNASNYAESIKTLVPLLNLKLEFDSVEQAAIYKLLAYSHINSNNYKEAQQFIDLVRLQYPGFMDERFFQNAGHLAYIHRNSNDFDYYIKVLHEVSPANQWLEYLKALWENDNENALEILQNELSETEHFFVESMANDLRNTAIGFYNVQNEKLRERDKRNTLTLIIVLVSVCLIISLLILVVIHKYRLHKNIMVAHDEFVLQLKDSLESTMAENLELKQSNQKWKELVSINIEKPQQVFINVDLPKNFDVMSRLCSAYYASNSSNSAKSSIYAELVDIISAFRFNSPYFDELTTFIDTHFDNIYTNFKEDFADFSNNDFELFAFLVLGFSSKVIAVLQGTDVEKFYARKTYLKRRVAKSPSVRVQTYLSHF